ncbi:MAG: ABC transporter permease subunit, partial [Anaerolineae bacterium]|nr:ABC transporter permease subunit [Anaerolineae bacterium]
RQGFIEQIIRPLVILPAALPVFWLGLMLVYHLGFKQEQFPLGGRCELSLTAACESDFDHLFLPVLSLTLPLTAAVTLFVRRSLTTKNVLNAVLRSLILNIAPLLAQLFSLVILVEAIFAWPGIGRALLESAAQRDYPVLLGILVTLTLWIIQAYLRFSVIYAIFSVLSGSPPQAYSITTQPYLQETAEEQARTRADHVLPTQSIANALMVVAVILLIFIILTALTASILTDQSQTNLEKRLLSPGDSNYVLGTDDLGRDFLERLLTGGRNSLSIAARAALIASGIGVVVGLIGGVAGSYLNKPVNFLINWGLATFNLLPVLGILILAVSVQEVDSRGELAVLIGLFSWGNGVPVVRAWVRGVRYGGIEGMLPHLAQTAGFVLVLNMAAALLLETSLSFIGMGVLPPDPSWGSLLSDAQRSFRQGGHLLTPPGLMLSLTLFALLMVMERLRDGFDFMRPEVDIIAVEDG